MASLSIITINYNDLEGLKKTTQSVFSQTFKDIEYIVIDGGSSDGSAEYIQQHLDRFYYSISEKDKGIFNAQNKGLAQATSDYCLFLNSGDCLANDNAIAEVMSQNLQADLILCNMGFVYDDGVQIRKQSKNIDFKLFATSSIWHPATLIKRSVFELSGPYNESFRITADYDFFLKAIWKYHASYQRLDIVLSHFDTTGVSSNPEHAQKHQDERMRVQAQYFTDEELNESLEIQAREKSLLTKVVQKIKRIFIPNA